MADKFNDDPEKTDTERFPTGPLKPGTSAVQIRVRLELAQALADLEPQLASLTLPDSEQVALSPLFELMHVLFGLGVRNCTWPLGITPALAKILTTEEKLERITLIEVTLPSSRDAANAVDRLQRLAAVANAVQVPNDAPPSHVGDPLMGHSDQDLEQQWYLFRMRVDQAWQYSAGADVVIADIDYGFLTTHPDLRNLDLDKGFNTADLSKVVDHGTSIGHGTAVMGLAGAALNGFGMIGVAHESSLWPIQGNSGPGCRVPGDKWARGIDYVLASDSGGRPKVAILENQTGNGGCYEQVESTRLAITQAINHGVVVVTAAGNGNRDVHKTDAGVEYPDSGSILAGATGFHTVHNPRACFSNYGPRITVSAPGYSAFDLTCSIDPRSPHRVTFGGTSGAAPKVAGVCALMLSVNPCLTVSDIKSIFTATGSEVITSPNRLAGKFIDAEAAVRAAMPAQAKSKKAP